MKTAFGKLALWIVVLVLAVSGVLLFNAGGMYIGLLVVGIAVSGTIALIVAQVVRDT